MMILKSVCSILVGNLIIGKKKIIDVVYIVIYMMDLNCDLSENRVNYYNLSRSFIELSTEKADSAFWALRAGMDINGETEVLLELGAYIAQKTNNIDDQLYYLEEVSELYPNNQRALEKLSSLYGKQERYDEQVEVLDLWLDFEICGSDSDLIKMKIMFVLHQKNIKKQSVKRKELINSKALKLQKLI